MMYPMMPPGWQPTPWYFQGGVPPPYEPDRFGNPGGIVYAPAPADEVATADEEQPQDILVFKPLEELPRIHTFDERHPFGQPPDGWEAPGDALEEFNGLYMAPAAAFQLVKVHCAGNGFYPIVWAMYFLFQHCQLRQRPVAKCQSLTNPYPAKQALIPSNIYTHTFQA